MGKTGEWLTVKAFAEEAGRSQQAIYKQLNTRLAAYVHERDGQRYIEKRALAEVFHIGEVQLDQPELNQIQSTDTTEENPLYEILKTELEAKNRQIEQLMNQLESKETEVLNLTAALENTTASLKEAQTSLKAAQALHAGTMQQQLEAAHEEPVAEVAVTEEPQSEGKTLFQWLKEKLLGE